LKSIDIGLVDRALIIKLRNIGDVLLTAPVFTALKAARPGVRLTALVPAGMEDMLTLNPDVDEVITVKRGSGMMYDLKLLKRLRASRFDLAINMTEGDRGALLAFFCGARFRIGFDPGGRGFLGKRLLFTSLAPVVCDGRHRAELDMDVLKPLGIEGADTVVKLYTSEEDDAFVRGLLSRGGIGPGDRYAVVHPTSRWLFKCWRDEAMAAVIDYLEGRGIRVVVTAAPEEEELARVKNMLSTVRSKPLDLSGRLSLKRLAALMKKSVLFFGVDTAPMHMAAAVGVPVVALFGPSDSTIWGPHSKSAMVVDKRDEFNCVPCNRDGCDGSKKSKCMEAITVDEAVRALEAVMAAKVALFGADSGPGLALDY